VSVLRERCFALDFLQKLLLMKKLRMEKGEIMLLESRLTLTPVEVSTTLTSFLMERKEDIPRVYEEIRVALREGWSKTVREFYKPQPLDYMLMMFEIGSITGWGESHLLSFDADSLSGSLQTFDAPISEALKGKATVHADVFWRAQGAGVSSTIFGKDMDWFETKCLAVGDSVCEFHFMPRDSLKRSEYAAKYPGQVP